VNPVIAVLLGAIVLGETITAATIAGAVLVLAGVALVLFQNVKFPWLPQLLPGRARDSGGQTSVEGTH
jgi:drug/metabolite transporter (DMT)-like permease